ncbi:hypothetical protein HFN_0772 [Helicobacter fennelliae MRY12-0050]|uniref:Uncharacterized protein n=1 Tax=Helicobacter fennelliae MRY12-0050 TaxID=1325130 RepID=T1DWM3_9HELI|nr:hypothetical protein HFN_0772 [Helicobacter fennelliae MRY12-0050]
MAKINRQKPNHKTLIALAISLVFVVECDIGVISTMFIINM